MNIMPDEMAGGIPVTGMMDDGGVSPIAGYGNTESFFGGPAPVQTRS